jgi:hypothetical protein
MAGQALHVLPDAAADFFAETGEDFGRPFAACFSGFFAVSAQQ